MGLPEIVIEFRGKAVSAINRSALGIVALILRDPTNTKRVTTLKSIEDIVNTEWTPENVDYLNKTFLGTPSKVIALRASAEETIADLLKELGGIKFNYMAMPDATVEESTAIASWIKSKRLNEKKTYKAVLANQSADDEGIINFTTTGIKVGEKDYTTTEYTCRVAGILAGLPFTRSATYFVLNEVDSITEHVNPDEAIDSGELILVNDGEQIKIGRGVNSLTTTTIDKTEDFMKIKIVEIMDMIKDDIRDTFNNEYVGKVPNTYDNQVLFFTSVNAYFKGLAADSILDPSFENMAGVNVEAQRRAWEGIGTDTTDWDDLKVKNMPFRSNVFARANIKIVDSIEDLDFLIEI